MSNKGNYTKKWKDINPEELKNVDSDELKKSIAEKTKLLKNGKSVAK